jgi:transposase InsO family protein
MRYPTSEKLEIIRTVEGAHLPTRQTLKMLSIPSSTYYDWYARWSDGGIDRLADRSPRPGSVWNRISDTVRDDIVDFALEHEDLTPRELAVKYTDEKRYFVSESSVYRILSAADLITAPAHVVMRAADEFRDKTTQPNELWQTDFTYLKVIGWGWFYLSTILDDYSRFIIAWKLCTMMKATDVTDTLDLALQASGCDNATVVHKPRLLSDNGSSYVAADLADYLASKGMDHVRGAPHHPQTQGKIERWHQTMKNRVLMENYFLPGDLERQIGAFVTHYNNHRYHESLDNPTPADVYHGRGAKILKMREEIKKQTIRKRRLQHKAAAALIQTETEPEPSLAKHLRSPENSDDEQNASRSSGSIPVIKRRSRPKASCRIVSCNASPDLLSHQVRLRGSDARTSCSTRLFSSSRDRARLAAPLSILMMSQICVAWMRGSIARIDMTRHSTMPMSNR